MVQVLLSAVVLVGIMGLLNLLLTIGAIRRLRRHADVLSRLNDAGGTTALAQIGQEIREFSATTVDGQPIDDTALSGETLVGFFSARCKLCRVRLPGFVALARSMPGGPDQVLAVATGAGEEAADIVKELRPVAQVVMEGYGGPLGAAFQVKKYPTMVKVAPNENGQLAVVDNQVTVDAADLSDAALQPPRHHLP